MMRVLLFALSMFALGFAAGLQAHIIIFRGAWYIQHGLLELALVAAMVLLAGLAITLVRTERNP